MDTTELDQRYRVGLLIWAGLVGGVVLFAGIVWALTSGLLGEAPEPVLDPTVARLALAVPVIFLLAGIVLRRREVPWGTGEDPLGRWITGAIVAWAIQEGGGLFGVAVAFLTAQPGLALAMGGLTAFAMLLTRPARDELTRIGRR